MPGHKTINAVPRRRPAPQLLFDFIEFFSMGSHVGKSMFTTYLAALLRSLGIDVVIVRIESKAARSKDADIFIDSEDFAASARLPGGEVALLRPVYDALRSAAEKQIRPLIMLDWGGGLSEYRAKIYAATRFDDRLADHKLRGLSIVVTTSLVDRMRHASELIEQTRILTPGLDRALLLNSRVGKFAFVKGTEEHRIFSDLQEAAKGARIIRIPAITGETWQSCEAAGLSMVDTIKLPLPELAQRLGEDDPFSACAYQMQVATWWQKAEREFLKALVASDAAAPR